MKKMSRLYNASMHAMGAAMRLSSPFHAKVSKMMAGRRETISRLRALRATAPAGTEVVWVHAASLGEFEQGRPLMERLRRERPESLIVLSFFSPSGYEVRKDWTGADAVVYLPIDTPRAVSAFLEALRPSIAIFVKYEFWGNFLAGLRRRGVPTYIISAIFRPGQIFFRPWGGVWRDMLDCFTRIYVQDENSRALLAGIGVSNVTVAGDTRFDRVRDVRSRPCAIAGLDALMRKEAGPRIVFGSSWPADEAVYMPWLASRPDVRFIIAPHEFDATRLEALRAAAGEGVMLLSEWQAAGSPAEGVRGLIVDSFGHLSSLYRYADAAYVGGGFGTGLHNINEAAVYGIPVLYGPENRKFREAAGLREAGGGFVVESADSFATTMEHLLSDRAALRRAGRAAGAYITDNLGATDKIYESIFRR